jgi:hypothetical protein
MMWRAARRAGLKISDIPEFVEVKEIINKMGKKKRCLYETELFLTANKHVKESLQKWFDICVPRMSEVVNG